MAEYPIAAATATPVGGDKSPRSRSATQATSPPTDGDKSPRSRTGATASPPVVEGTRYHNPEATTPTQTTHVYRSGQYVVVEDDTQ